MSIENLYKERAMLMAAQVPVPPRKLIYDNGFRFIEPALTELKGVGIAQQWLNQAIENHMTMTVEPGTKAQIIYWDGKDGIVAGFNREGIQVAYGHAQWNKDPRNREQVTRIMSYDTAYIVGSKGERQGIATAMMNLLETHVAVNNNGYGASFFYTIHAETHESKEAAAKMLQRIGAKVSQQENFYLRLALKPGNSKKRSSPGLTVLPSNEIISSVFY